MWDAINIASNHDLISLDMILVEKEETLIHASIRKNLAQTYRPQLIEGSIYTITNFLVEENKGNYRPVHNKFKILFNSATSISKFSGIDHSIPQSQFEFADYGTIASRCYDNTYLSDVIGILDYIGAIEEIKTRGRPTKIRNIQLLLEETKSIQTTLWGNTAHQIDDDFYKTNKGPFIVIVTSTIVKTFRGDYQLSSTFATKLYVNLDIPEVAEIRNKLNTTIDVNVKEILPKRLLKVQDEELASQNKKTVAEIKNLEWNSETKDLMVTCNAKIININNKYGWYYVACLICKTKVKQVKGVLWCERCKNEPKFAVPSYRIQVEVQDETGSTTFILFDKGAEKIISKTAKELAEMQEEILKLDENILPKEIQKIIGNKYLFQLHLDEYNLKYGKEDYTVSKILDMEISHKQNDSCKVEEHQNILEEIVRKPKKDKYIAGQKIEIGETSVERSELTAPTTTEDGRTGHKRMPLQMLQKRQKGTRQNASKKKKF
ncbi:replication protein A 70 kDa DNA-binding subunit A-like [Quercus lobata]|uniref:replication protein A 70 kDa DNA-binding subunit A-like n=1 Tax=Quercus lobata TaxID=97700 RepID=UPI001246D1A7|nr:replication protein A 70 kDa DNA-binding subunit A-like [Quercus lobata]